MIRLLEKNEPLPWTLLLDADPDKEVVERYIYDSEILVDCRKETIVACLVYQIRGAEAELLNLAVLPSHQRQGIAKDLIKQALLMIQAHAAKPTTVLVKTGNSTLPALALYKQMGFQEVARIKDYFLTHYREKIYEEGILLTDQIILSQTI
ncbi:GNAT family acetyltransferase [Enterococcus sp. JM4C]|uniref:GNAT family N-acetyltransferase n=1 Tax=Candidatus Enterococcus huntleyi TaxID=1857217 RepID=UPI00137AA1A9|nr:GNAT family N-acetyltransferase [Enterococcus sp. JM4C]KAF1295757.1 GNAT family acetyltransferase [Enterococcus sp. JM4C]